MKDSTIPELVDVVILCGGLGKRLRAVVDDRPKPMIEINGRVFLDILIDYVRKFGFKRFILCIGYMGYLIKEHYQARSNFPEIIFSEEKELLGTGGAVKHAEPLIKTSHFLVMNGDSFIKLDLKKFLKFHLEKNYLLSIVLTNVADSKDYGSVSVGESQRIIKFEEKSDRGRDALVSSGIYLFQKKILELIPPNKVLSLEKDIFPQMVSQEMYGYITDAKFIDIGTAERYKQAQQFLK